jgi:hypothetical protein
VTDDEDNDAINRWHRHGSLLSSSPSIFNISICAGAGLNPTQPNSQSDFESAVDGALSSNDSNGLIRDTKDQATGQRDGLPTVDCAQPSATAMYVEFPGGPRAHHPAYPPRAVSRLWRRFVSTQLVVSTNAETETKTYIGPRPHTPVMQHEAAALSHRAAPRRMVPRYIMDFSHHHGVLRSQRLVVAIFCAYTTESLAANFVRQGIAGATSIEPRRVSGIAKPCKDGLSDSSFHCYLGNDQATCLCAR